MTRLSRFFGLPIPDVGQRDWGQRLLDWIQQAEVTLGCNSNQVMTGDDSYGLSESFTLAHISGPGTMDKANPTEGRWGRLLLQQAMVEGEESLGRLVGITQIVGLPSSLEFGTTLYHHAGSNALTEDPAEAVLIDSEGRLVFLPLGYCFAAAGRMFFNGLTPLQVCPVRLSSKVEQYKDGSLNPSGNFATAFDAGPALTLVFDAAVDQKHTDLMVPFLLGGEFDRWAGSDDPSVWAFRALFKTSGTATLSAYSVIDTAHVEHVIAGAGTASPGDYGWLSVMQKTIADLDGTFEPGRVCYLRLRATGASSAQIWVRPTPLVQYFPWIRWEG